MSQSPVLALPPSTRGEAENVMRWFSWLGETVEDRQNNCVGYSVMVTSGSLMTGFHEI